MALIDSSDSYYPQLPIPDEVGAPEAQDPTFWETLGAAGRLDSEIIGGFSRETVTNKIDPDFDVFEAIKGTEWESDPELFVDVHSPEAFTATKLNIEQEREDREILYQSGWVGVGASMGASLISPTTLIPGGALVKTAGAGYKIGKSALTVGSAALAATAVQETVLQQQQAERPLTETGAALVGSMVIGSIFGGTLAGFATRAESRAIANKYARELAGDDVTGQEIVRATIDELRAEPQGVGAAQTPKQTFDDLAIADGTAGAAAIVARMSKNGLIPNLQTMQSPSVATRRVLNDLTDQAAYTKANFEGRTQGPSVENMAKYWQRGALAGWLKKRDGLYLSARKAGYKGTRAEFNTEVGMAARRNDEHPVDEIAQAASDLRTGIFEPLLKRSTMPDDVKTVTAPSYFHRVWNTRKMLAEETQIKAVFDRYYRGAIKSAQAEAKAKNIDAMEFVNDADFEDYVSDLVCSTFNNITGLSRDGEVPDWIVPLERGPLKGRTFKIPDEMVEEFLESDAELIARRYTRVMGAEVELAEKFGRADMRDQFKEIDLDYEKLRGEIEDDKKLSPKQQ